MNKTYIETPEIGGTQNFATGSFEGVVDLLTDLDKNKEKEPVNVESALAMTRIMTEMILNPILAKKEMSFLDLEKLLQGIFHPGSVLKFGRYRFATSFNVAGTRFERSDDNVEVKDSAFRLGESGTDYAGNTTKSNMSGEQYMAIDALGFSSKSASPTGGYESEDGKHAGYGILGKIPELRPMNEEGFNPELYEKIMKTKGIITFTGFSIEHNDEETVVMPTFTVNGEKIQELISHFSSPVSDENKTDVPTAKKWLTDNA